MTEHDNANESAPDPSNTTPTDSSGTPSDAAPQKLLVVDDELKLWLDHTGFFDLAHRKRVLDGVRELHGLEAEKAKVLKKIQSSKPSGQPASEPCPSANSTSIQKKRHTREDAVHGAVSLPYSRYFLVKSSNTTNVYMSRRDGLWITQAKNGPLFTQAFRECRSVVLFFSINKSKAFQGYAKMTSAPDRGIPQPPWIVHTTMNMHTTAPFRIDWLNESETPFSQLSGLKNPYNEYNAVFVGRDGQEYPEDCARFMMGVMDRVKLTRGSHAPGISSTAHAGRQKSKADVTRRLASAAGLSCPGGQPRADGLSGSRWRRPGTPSPLSLSLDLEPGHDGDEDLLLDYP
ncbi:YT521-B-like family protein [Metarhizium album ARSEF 1941]|uniref:YT521-B-like family protein n=1 Tax=Metarhizium album (strain ARSEF 1941) TaxID=1081103 RepID=A0A0B2WZM1_METAS|nr:YT521-B-like family protein [Metarhizium album ARSEF 1941]KHN99034.1 YT521-B-like family protein [Metarhizium album ARSEF 1941]